MYTYIRLQNNQDGDRGGSVTCREISQTNEGLWLMTFMSMAASATGSDEKDGNRNEV